MFLRKLQSPRGWRAFFGEVGIIVLGVLIALGADQALKTWNQRNDMRELRAAIDAEIAYGLGSFSARLEQEDCVQARLDELTLWLRDWRAGKPQRLSGPISAPRSGPPNTSVWAGREPGVIVQMPMDVKLAYGGIYDSFANTEVQRLDERMTWLALAEYDEVEQLDNASMMRLQGLLTRARWRANNIKLNAAELTQVAKDLGIEPQPYSFPAADVAPLCLSILPAPGKQPGAVESTRALAPN